MAPEVFMGTKYTEKCDIYAWAIVFYQLLTKQHNPYKEWQCHSAGRLSCDREIVFHRLIFSV